MTGNSNGRESFAGKQVFTTGEAAKVCNVSQQTIIRCFDSGRLEGFRVPGSRFRRIPRAELIRFMQKNGIPTERLDAGPIRVLVVDDDPEIVRLLEDALGAEKGVDVRSAATGYDAGMLTESFRPHVMLLDYMLPDINGNLVCQRLRANPELASTRVVIVSGVVRQSEVDALLQSGADAFVRKPFDIRELIGKVRALASA